MHLLFLDLETTGLPQTPSFGKWYHYTELDKYSTSTVLSICMYLYIDNKLVNKFYTYIKHDNKLEINNTHIHGITESDIQNKGVEWDKISSILETLIDNTDFIIGHNVLFDTNVLSSELYRNGYENLAEKISKKEIYCTKVNGKIYCKLNKYPKLSELYKILFNKEMEGAHNAEMDVINCAECYFRMNQN